MTSMKQLRMLRQYKPSSLYFYPLAQHPFPLRLVLALDEREMTVDSQMFQAHVVIYQHML